MNEQKLQELFDKEAIRELRYKFAQALDYKDWALLEDLLLDELEADFTLWGVPPQRVKLADFVNSFKQTQSRTGLKTQHIFANFRITVNGDNAICQSYLLAQHYIQGFAGGEEFYLRAEYRDTLVRTGAGWKISGVTLAAVFYVVGNPAILVS